MKTAAINLSFKLLILTSFIVSANFAMASGDIVECQPGYSQIEELSRPVRLLPPLLHQRLSCARVNHFTSEPSQKNLQALCVDYAACGKKLNPSNAHDLLAQFITKKRLEDELPRSMIYSAVKKFLEKENAFPAHAMNNGKINHRCATDEYTIDGSISYKKSKQKPVFCRKEIFNNAGIEFYRKCGQNKPCFGDLDSVLGNSKLIDDKGNKSKTIEEFIQKNTSQLAEYYQSQNSDEYIEEIRLALLENKDILSVLKKYRDKSPVLMAMYMSSSDYATRQILKDLNPIIAKEVSNLKKAPKTNSSDFKATFKKFQIALGQGMFSKCSTDNTFFPFSPSEICNYAGRVAKGELEVLQADQYSGSELINLYNNLEANLEESGSSNPGDNAVDLICKIKMYSDKKDKTSINEEFAGAYGVGYNAGSGGGVDSFRYGDTDSSSSDYSENAAMDHEQDIAVINKAAADFGKTETDDENAVIQANNQNLRGQNNVDSQAFINNFQPIDNYSGLTNEYVNKSYINRADKLKADKETSASSDSSLNKQYNDIEAKIAEAEARLKELQQSFGEVGKNAKNQPVVSDGVGREKTQTSSEIEELLKEIKELKAQNNEIKEKLVAKASSEKAEKAAEKNQSASFGNSSGLAFSSGNKNDYKYESKPVEIKPTSSYSASQGSSQSLRAPSSLGAAKLGAQSSGAILSAVDSKADAGPARAVTRVDSFNSESARKAITSRINEINKNTKEMEQSKATIEIDGQLKEVISFEVLDETGKKKLVVVELKDGKVVVDKDGNPIYISQDVSDDSIVITKKGKDEKSIKKLQSQADVKRVDELKVQKGRSAERVKLNDLTRSAVKEKP